MGVVFGGIVPHPPIIVPAIGKSNLTKAQKTVEGMSAWAKDCMAKQPDTVVIISPHGPVFQDAIGITATERVTGDLGSFGAPQVGADLENDLELVDAILNHSRQRQVSVGKLDASLAKDLRVPLTLDHGTLVPLFYLMEAGFKGKVVPIAMGLLPKEELFAFGLALRDAMGEVNRPVALIASGDLSHRLTPDAPAGYSPQGAVFDLAIERAVRDWDINGLFNIDEILCEKAGECGYRPIIMLAGVFDDQKVASHVYSYEGPFGVGYLVASLTFEGRTSAPTGENRLAKFQNARMDKLKSARENESLLVRFARQTLEAAVQHKKIPHIPPELEVEQAEPAGVFVSIKTKGQLRGCIGTIEPTQSSLGAEIRHNAIAAGTRDPRFFPVEPDELDELFYSVDVLGPEEPIDSIEQLDPRRYGVIVRAGGRQGLLLPMLEGVDTAEEQVNIARQKAGIPEGTPLKLSRFEVIRYY